MALRIARSALEDLRGIKAHYSEQGVAHIGREYVAAVLKHAEMLQQHPDGGE
jgi:toxin ParE1/3/4